MYKSNKFCDILGIEEGISSVIGSGGKTSLILRLADELADRAGVISCTSTRILKPDKVEIIYGVPSDRIEKGHVCVGTEAPENPAKLAAPACSIAELCSLAAYVLNEADGSAHLPLKAHREYEPVIPDESSQVILVMGLSGIGGRVADKVHRPELFTALTGAGPDEIISPELAAAGLRAELDRYKGYRLKLFFNQTDLPGGWELAGRMAELMPGCSCFGGSVRDGLIRKL